MTTVISHLCAHQYTAEFRARERDDRQEGRGAHQRMHHLGGIFGGKIVDQGNRACKSRDSMFDFGQSASASACTHLQQFAAHLLYWTCQQRQSCLSRAPPHKTAAAAQYGSIGALPAVIHTEGVSLSCIPAWHITPQDTCSALQHNGEV